jgi:transposase InsO family protein
MLAAEARHGVHCGRKRVARLMRRHHLVGVHTPATAQTRPTIRSAAGPPLRPWRALTSLAFSSRVTELQLDQSFSGVGSCYDCEQNRGAA